MQRILGTFGGFAALVSAGLSASVCTVPFVAIALGVGGFGWLTRYSALQMPLLVLSLAMIAATWLARRMRRKTCGRKRLETVLLGCATIMAMAVIAFEYVVVPNLY